MSSSVFTQIASGSRAARAERLFNAAVTAFCALTRPSRAEIEQIDDLTLPLLQHVSAPCLRFAAAALSDCGHAPPGLVRQLCENDVEVAAPLLARSPVLRDADLIELIGRHGLPHARIIARRPDLHPTVAETIQALFRAEGLATEPPQTDPDPAAPPAPGQGADNTRRRLRGMMRGPSEQGDPGPRKSRYEHLRDLALLGHSAFFHTALADASGLSLADGERAAADADALLQALCALELSAEQAFVIVAAVLPATAQGKPAIRSLLDRFATIAAEADKTTAPTPDEQGKLTASAVYRFKRT